MPLSQLDANAALIVIDLQKGIVGLPTFSPTAPVVARSAALAKAFRASGRPVVLVNVVAGAPGRTDAEHRAFPEDPAFVELVPELEQASTDHLVSKHRWGAFQTTDLDSWLRGKGVEQLVIVGIATSVGVESTARYAHELGYHVVLVPDAMTDLNADAHHNSVTRIFPRIAETTDTQTLLAKLG
ncbi:MAG: Isochorismatase family protein YecD [Luteibacter sp.]|uniref:isochorismatase family protein n=1 Tax=Luteibacter sp. TaxID=1886636 RepID=UPI00137E9F20|nr:isochorismatase family protein [Luteibacter sp.]KAF1008239.1 MAG: Isochorismatase family protein YecD [Luteibacter sp.]